MSFYCIFLFSPELLFPFISSPFLFPLFLPFLPSSFFPFPSRQFSFSPTFLFFSLFSASLLSFFFLSFPLLFYFLTFTHLSPPPFYPNLAERFLKELNMNGGGGCPEAWRHKTLPDSAGGSSCYWGPCNVRPPAKRDRHL